METLSLFKELENPVVALKAAITADVEAAGGAKTVATLLWPDENIKTSHPRLLNACNPRQKQELGYHDIQQLKLLARKKSGASHIHAFESKALNCDLHWVSQEEQVERSERRLEDLLHQVATELQEMKAARAAK